MYDENLKNRVFQRLEAALRVYDRLIYRKVGTLEHAQVFYTKEHLRSVPDSGFAPIEVGTSWGGEWNNAWIKGDFTVPQTLDGKALYALSHCGGPIVTAVTVPP